ncbi:glyoxylate reductase/hydroxypyruvate reductase-like [Uloborus diversus]|uniref:glyoxylate reductase/hydroxypyruvate reductase-like n=1 Tax=Uloborus diversus TaxID=327109 RepID=UPI00240A06EC|nr:glyoxylate reductase/hydroxypyruvate reductase-like [Uloborus diversus]
MSKPKVLITRPSIPEEGIKKIEAKCDVEIYDQEKPIPKEDLIKKIKGVNGLFCLLTDPVDKDVIQAAGNQLKVIATMSVGYEHIDLEECKKRNIAVSHTPNVSSDSVAEWTVLLMLCAGRNFEEASTAIRDGKWVYSWSPTWLSGMGLFESTVGIFGMGRIGKWLVKVSYLTCVYVPRVVTIVSQKVSSTA